MIKKVTTLLGLTLCLALLFAGTFESPPADNSSVTLSNETANRAVILDAAKKVTSSTVTDTELGYVSGVTSALQTQLTGKASTTHASAHEDAGSDEMDGDFLAGVNVLTPANYTAATSGGCTAVDQLCASLNGIDAALGGVGASGVTGRVQLSDGAGSNTSDSGLQYSAGGNQLDLGVSGSGTGGKLRINGFDSSQPWIFDNVTNNTFSIKRSSTERFKMTSTDTELHASTTIAFGGIGTTVIRVKPGVNSGAINVVGSIKVGGSSATSPAANVALDVNFTDAKFMKLPSDSDPHAEASLLERMFIYDNTSNTPVVYNGTLFRDMYGTQNTEIQAASAAHTIDFQDGRHTEWDLQAATGNVTLTLSNPAQGETYNIKIIQSSTARTITWPGTVQWSGGTAPTLTATNDGVDLITLYYDGTNYLGTFTLNFN